MTNTPANIFLVFFCILLSVVSQNILAAQAQIPATTGGTQWTSYNNHLDGQRFSPLSEITPENASQMGEVCRIRINGPTGFNAGLLEIDGVIYTTSGRQTVAVDAQDCSLLWRHTYEPDDIELRPSNRGPAVLDGRLFRGTGDGRLIALDIQTGELLWKNEIGSPRLSEFVSGAPLAWQGMVFMGISGGDAGIRGRIMAYDAATGLELWRFNTIPMGDEFGAETWERAESAKTGGGGYWGAMTLDPTTGELFIPIGNPWPDIAHEYRPGNNLFTNSIVVLDAFSGELRWWHQAVAADTHDFDLVAPPVLYRNQSIQDVMVFSGKDGYVTGIDRDTKEVLFQTAVTLMENPDVPATEEGTYVCPGFAGGTGWNGPAMDNINNTLLIGTRGGGCMTIFPAPTVYQPPGVSYGGRVEPDPNSLEFGAVTALDAESGAIRWSFSAESPVIAAITPTAGGVLFTGDQNGTFLVIDTEKGNLLHQQASGGSMMGGVITYEREGKQYVAMASGNISRLSPIAGFPTIVIMALNPEPSKVIVLDVVSNQEVGEPDWVNGRGLFEQMCSTCHGYNGDAFADHTLSDINSRLNLEEIVTLIKAPNLPMPKMYPDMLTDQNIVDLGAYLERGIGR